MLSRLDFLRLVGLSSAVPFLERFGSGLPDFEDAIQYFAALSIPNITHIVTRDPKGFAASVIPVVSPTAALQLLS